MLKRSVFIGLVTAFVVAGILGVTNVFPGTGRAAATALDDLMGCEFDVGLGKNASVLWGVGADSVILRELTGDRLVFDDPSGHFASAYAQVLSDKDRFGYGPKAMSERPLVLSPTSFSVRAEDLAFLRRSGQIVWANPRHADFLDALKREGKL